MVKMYRVSLSEAQRLLLQKTVSSGSASARRLAHARILLKADEGPEGPGCIDTVIAEAVEVSVSTVKRVRQRCIQEGVEAALRHRPPEVPKSCKLDGKQEAHLTALACSAPPEGRRRWTLRLLAQRFAVLECGEVISHELVRHTLDKNDLKPHLKQQWCIPPKQNAEFVWRMEDVLDVYTRPYDPKNPQICFDEVPKQLVADSRLPLPLRPGTPAREDYEYERHGTANLFLWYEPLAGRRHVEVTAHRTRIDWAECIKDLVYVHYPDAERIVLVLDNLNIHSPASLYAAFPPAEAKRLADKLEIHWTPKHGSWLNAVEIELAILATQCLDRRIPDRETLGQEVAAWEDARNALRASVHWRFRTEDARIKLRHLYPTHEWIGRGPV
ncbi:MAG TPA: IS630 family transposase [Chloroflexota bacterium]